MMLPGRRRGGGTPACPPRSGPRSAASAPWSPRGWSTWRPRRRAGGRRRRPPPRRHRTARRPSGRSRYSFSASPPRPVGGTGQGAARASSTSIARKYCPARRADGGRTRLSRPRGNMEGVVTAVIFDFYGTLARWADTEAASYGDVFEAFGYTLEPSVLDAYFSRYDGVEHSEHSVSEEAYEAWVRRTPARPHDGVRRARRDARPSSTPCASWTRARWWRTRRPPRPWLRCARPGSPSASAPTGAGSSMRSSTRSGCSPWSTPAVTSARAGSRKPHPGSTPPRSAALGVDPDEVRLRRRLLGARRARAAPPRHAAVHVWRPEERAGQAPLRPATGRPPRRRADGVLAARRGQLGGPTGGRPFSARPAASRARSASVSGTKRVAGLSSGRHQTGSSQAQASARRPTLVTLPVAVWGSDARDPHVAGHPLGSEVGLGGQPVGEGVGVEGAARAPSRGPP